VKCARLMDGDRLGVGKHEIMVHISAEGERLPIEQRAIMRRAPLVPGSSLAVRPPRVHVPQPPAAPLARPDPVTPQPSGEPNMLAALIQQLALMQQQMMSQFQQVTLFTMQMLRGMQQEQRDLINQELDELQQINRNLEQVQGELAGLPARQA